MAKWVEHPSSDNIIVWYVDLTFCQLSFHIMKCKDDTFMVVNPHGLATDLVGVFFKTLDEAKNECYDHVRKSANMMIEAIGEDNGS